MPFTALSEQFFFYNTIFFVFLQFPVFLDDLDTFVGHSPKKVIIISVKWKLLINV
jgi:hypothetical protein